MKKSRSRIIAQDVSGVSLMKRVRGREAVNQAALARPAVCGDAETVAGEAKLARIWIPYRSLSHSRGTLGTLGLQYRLHFILPSLLDDRLAVK